MLCSKQSRRDGTIIVLQCRIPQSRRDDIDFKHDTPTGLNWPKSTIYNHLTPTGSQNCNTFNRTEQGV